MIKHYTKSLVLVCLFLSSHAVAEKAAVTAKSTYEIGKHIGNLVGIGYGAKMMLKELQPRCTKLMKEDSYKDALAQWEKRNQKVLTKSYDLWDKTVLTLKELNKKIDLPPKQKQVYSKMISQFSSMIDTMKMTFVNKLNTSPAASQVGICKNVVSKLNSKKMDVINRDKALYDKLLTWDLKIYQRELLKMLQPS